MSWEDEGRIIVLNAKFNNMSEHGDLIINDNKKYVKPEWIEVPRDWGKNIHGRLVTFGDLKDLAWGVELSVPITHQIRKLLGNSGIEIPEHIETIKYVDLAPQESLPKKERNIRADDDQNISFSPLNSLANVTDISPHLITFSLRSRPTKTIGMILQSLLIGRTSKIEFNEILKESKSCEILIAYGHGRDDPFHSGEQYNDQPNTKGEATQRIGNRVLATEVLEKYNDPNKYSVIMFRSCYLGKEGIKPNKVPIVYVQGAVASNPIGRFWGDLTYGKAKTVIILPKEQKQN